MFDVDVLGTPKITTIFRAEQGGHGQRDTQVDVCQCSKLQEAWISKLATWPKDTPDLLITRIKNPLKSGLGKKLSRVYHFRHKTLTMTLQGHIFFVTYEFERF